MKTYIIKLLIKFINKLSNNRYIIIWRNHNYRENLNLDILEELEEYCIFCNDFYDWDVLINNSITWLEIKWLIEFRYFYIRENDWFYDNAKNHLMICSKRHIKSDYELTDEEKIELINIRSIYKNDWYISFSQEFNRSKHSSIYHWHEHLIKY